MKKDDIKKVEDLLRLHKAITDKETFYDFVLKPVDQSSKVIENIYYYLRDNLGGGVLLKIPVLITISGTFFEVEESTDTVQLKINAGKLKEHTNRLIIKDLSPLILKFFKWDLERRVWKHPNDEYKIAFLQKIATELDDELQGKNQIVKKYVQLLIEFGISMIKDMSSNIKLDKTSNSETLAAVRKLEGIVKTDKLNDVIDEDTEGDFSEIYAPLAQNYINGLLKTSNKYDFLLYAFIEAQNDYKKLVKNLLSPSIASDLNQIHHALSIKDIDTFISYLRAIFKSVPNQLYGKQNEAIYHISFHIILKLVGCEILSEVSTSDGRIDTVIEFPDLIYIIEIKLTNADDALRQIKEKEYDVSYRHKNKSLILLGLAFDTKTRNLCKDYRKEEIKH